MTGETVHVVIGRAGEYSDTIIWIVGAFRSARYAAFIADVHCYDGAAVRGHLADDETFGWISEYDGRVTDDGRGDGAWPRDIGWPIDDAIMEWGCYAGRTDYRVVALPLDDFKSVEIQ